LKCESNLRNKEIADFFITTTCNWKQVAEVVVEVVEMFLKILAKHCDCSSEVKVTGVGSLKL
jgi:hypothetical protein